MPPDAACILTGKKYPGTKRHGNFPSPCRMIHISEERSAVCPGSGKKEIPLQLSGKNIDFISEAAPENQAFKAVMRSVHVSGRSLHPDNQRSIHDSSGLFSFPHMQSGSSTGDFPRPRRLHSACGYSVRKIGWPASGPFRLVLSSPQIRDRVQRKPVSSKPAFST